MRKAGCGVLFVRRRRHLGSAPMTLSRRKQQLPMAGRDP
jgi:hypothetical protein